MGIRALVLLAVVVVVGIWVLSMALDVIGFAVKLVVWVVIAIVALAGIAAARRRMRRG